MKHGEIRWYKFNQPDKKRPVLILSRDSVIDYLGEITVAPITSSIRNIPTEVYLTITDGMPKNCAINLDHIQTVSKHKISSLITKLNDKKMEEVKQALMFAFDFFN